MTTAVMHVHRSVDGIHVEYDRAVPADDLDAEVAIENWLPGRIVTLTIEEES